jgi:hypothetical protein
MFRRATREIRVTGGLLLILVAVAIGLFELHRVSQQANRDFALCGSVRQAPDCASKLRPVSVSWTESSSNGFERKYQVEVQTRQNVTVSLGGLSKADVAPFEGLQTTEIRYHQGRLVAFVAPGGAALKLPLAVSMHLLVVLGSAAVAGLLGAGSVAWGLTRVNRTPRA